MVEEESPESLITITELPQEDVVCPFSRGKWKKFGDALVFFILFVSPVLFL